VAGDAGCGDDWPDTREHLVKGKSIKEIARDLKISRNTVRKILRSGETSFSYEGWKAQVRENAR
jgi:transposase